MALEVGGDAQHHSGHVAHAGLAEASSCALQTVQHWMLGYWELWERKPVHIHLHREADGHAC